MVTPTITWDPSVEAWFFAFGAIRHKITHTEALNHLKAAGPIAIPIPHSDVVPVAPGSEAESYMKSRSDAADA